MFSATSVTPLSADTTGIASDYRIRTESERGNGRVDIILKPKRPGIVPIIIELKKSAEEKDLEADARAGLRQIHEKRYYLGMKGTVLLYGISFLGKVPFIAHDRLDTGRVLANLYNLWSTRDMYGGGPRMVNSIDGRPVMTGVDDFKRVRSDGGYYIDKTALIDEIVHTAVQVCLFTRPRRFGKTLNLSMLDAYFNEKYTGNTWFDGLRISGLRPDDPMKNSFIVITLSMKDLKTNSYEDYLWKLGRKIGDIYDSFPELQCSKKISNRQKTSYRDISMISADEKTLQLSLFDLTRMLEAEYGRKVILLIDEYDNAVNEAGSEELRRKILDFTSEFLSPALKSNTSLAFAVVTGVMQIAKASIFSGLNNLYVNSVFDRGFDEYWGFTENEVRKLCADFGDESKFEEAKEWYDGYRFGIVDVYNPWSVLNYVKAEFDAKPYWSNTSSNSILHMMYENVDLSRFGTLLDIYDDGIEVDLDTTVTYADSLFSERVMYSVMVMTGYLKAVHVAGDSYVLSIPNGEVRRIVSKMLSDDVGAESKGFREFSNAVLKGDVDSMERLLGEILCQGSYLNLKDEGCYELVVMTVLYGIASDYRIRTESERGNGRVDIILEPKHPGIVPIIIELKKSAGEKDLEADARAGLRQIHEKRYYLGMNGTVLLYGISFLGKVPFIAHERFEIRP